MKHRHIYLIIVGVIIIFIPVLVLVFLSSQKDKDITADEEIIVPTKRDLTVTTSKAEYFEGDMISILVENNLDKAIWHDGTCSIGPCSYFRGELSCIRLEGINCLQSKLEATDRISIQYFRPIRKDEIQFKFFYIENRTTPPFEYKEILSNEIVVRER